MNSNETTNSKTQAGLSAQAQSKDAGKPVKPGTDIGQDEVQTRIDKETEQGFRGVAVDPTPNENYTVAGVTANKPTPETDPKAAEKAKSA